MSTFLVAWAKVVLLGMSTTVTGRALVALGGVRPLRRLTPESLAASAVLGTGAWALFLGWFFYGGAAAGTAAGALGVGLAGLFIGLAVRRRLGWLRPHGRPLPWAVAGILCFLGGSQVLLPLARYQFFDPFNDATNYSSVA